MRLIYFIFNVCIFFNMLNKTFFVLLYSVQVGYNQKNRTTKKYNEKNTQQKKNISFHQMELYMVQNRKENCHNGHQISS